MKKIAVIGPICLIVIIIFYIFLNRPDSQLKSKCPDLDIVEHGRDYNFTDCFGILVVDSVNPVFGYKFRIRDFKHNYQIIGFNNYKSFTVHKGMLYLAVESKPEDELNRGPIKKDFFIDDRLQLFTYEKGQFPEYLIVDTLSGEVIPYTKLEDLPENDRKIFESLK